MMMLRKWSPILIALAKVIRVVVTLSIIIITVRSLASETSTWATYTRSILVKVAPLRLNISIGHSVSVSPWKWWVKLTPTSGRCCCMVVRSVTSSYFILYPGNRTDLHRINLITTGCLSCYQRIMNLPLNRKSSLQVADIAPRVGAA